MDVFGTVTLDALGALLQKRVMNTGEKNSKKICEGTPTPSAN
jgi:hypothetical protein